MTTDKQFKKAARAHAAARGISYTQAVRELRDERTAPAHEAPPTAISMGIVTRAAEGKTTTTAHLAALLFGTSAVPLIIDADPAASASPIARTSPPEPRAGSNDGEAPGERTLGEILRQHAARPTPPIFLDPESEAITTLRNITAFLIDWVIAAAQTNDPQQAIEWCARHGRPLDTDQQATLTSLLAGTRPWRGDHPQADVNPEEDYLDNLVALLSDPTAAVLTGFRHQGRPQVDPLAERFDAMAAQIGPELPPRTQVVALRIMVAAANEAPRLSPRIREFLRTQLDNGGHTEHLVAEITSALAQLPT